MRRWKQFVVMALLAGMPACMKWKQVPVPTPPAPPNIVSNLSRVTTTNGSQVEFLTLVVATDSLFGVRNLESRLRMSVGIDQVRRIEVREKDAPRTLGLLGLIMGGLYFSGAMGLGPNR